MKNYNTYIKDCISKKYKYSTNFDTFLLKNYYKNRKFVLKKLLNTPTNYDYVINNDHTYYFLRNTYLKQKTKKKAILNFYKKFEINLSLKKEYNNKFEKTSPKETTVASYVYLGLLVELNQNLDRYQKINCILKITDKLLHKPSNLQKCNSSHLIKLLEVEKKILKNLS